MKQIIKFSKSYNDILKFKLDFFSKNKMNFSTAIKMNKMYLEGPNRKKCKNCLYPIKNFFIKSFGVKYSLCQRCNHLNGEKQETRKFFNKLYISGQSSKNIEKNYNRSFKGRVKNIYNSKVLFLKKVIKKKISILDVGSGAGHFLKALENHNLYARGIEPNKLMCKVGNKYLKKNILTNVSLDKLEKIITGEKKANCLSAIGVLEHIEDPHRLLTSFKNSNLKYLYISVPLFSLTSLIENSFKDVYPRHLSGGHTHLYTKESLYYLAKKWNLKILGEWWFGLDIADLYRSIYVSSNNINKKVFNKTLNKYFFDALNEMQNCLDKRKISSEVHLVLSK